MLDRFRTRIGAFVVQLGVRIIGVDPDSLDRRSISDPEDEEYGESLTFVPAELNEHARKMVQEGLAATPPTRAPSVPNVLAGSAAARMADERRKQQEAMRPRKR